MQYNLLTSCTNWFSILSHMLKIRLQRIGRRHDPQFRVLVTDTRNGPKSGDFIEIVGSYNAKLGTIQLAGDRIKHWLSVGAQASDTVYNMLISQSIIEGKKRNALPKKSPIIKEKTEAEKKAEAAALAATVVAEEAPAPAEPTEEAVAEALVPEEASAEEAVA